MELNWFLSKLQLLRELQNATRQQQSPLHSHTALWKVHVYLNLISSRFVSDISNQSGLFVIFKMKRMNGRRRRARGRQYDSLRNSSPSPHCVVVFYTYLHLDSFIYCLFELFSFLENRRVLSPLSLLPRSNSSLHLLFQRLRYTYHGICRRCHFLSISDTILLIFHLPDNTNFNHFVKF